MSYKRFPIDDTIDSNERVVVSNLGKVVIMLSLFVIMSILYLILREFAPPMYSEDTRYIPRGVYGSLPLILPK
jgi:hypothetical protein